MKELDDRQTLQESCRPALQDLSWQSCGRQLQTDPSPSQTKMRTLDNLRRSSVAPNTGWRPFSQLPRGLEQPAMQMAQ